MEPVIAQREVFAYPARVVLAHRAPDAESLDAIVKANHALDASAFTDNPPFFWTALISTDELDTYFTRMAESTLRNFSTAAQAGISFQNSHRTGELPFGRSIAGRYLDGGVGGGNRGVEADFYTALGLNLNGVLTDDLVKGMRLGLVHDVSVGFYGGQFRCSICGRDMLRDWDCSHYPGMVYDRLDDAGNVMASETATAWIENANLSEVSAVYDGACPSAAIMKAHERLAGGELNDRMIALLEQQYRVNLPRLSRGQYPTPTRQEDPVSVNPNPPAPAQDDAGLRLATENAELTRRIAQFRTGLVSFGLNPAEAGTDDPLGWALRRLEEQRQTVIDGEQYRRDQIALALVEGKRAYGTDFDEASYRGLIERASIPVIQRMAADWKIAADAILPGGRATQDGGEAAPESMTQRRGRRENPSAYAS